MKTIVFLLFFICLATCAAAEEAADADAAKITIELCWHDYIALYY